MRAFGTLPVPGFWSNILLALVNLINRPIAEYVEDDNPPGSVDKDDVRYHTSYSKLAAADGMKRDNAAAVADPKVYVVEQWADLALRKSGRGNLSPISDSLPGDIDQLSIGVAPSEEASFARGDNNTTPTSSDNEWQHVSLPGGKGKNVPRCLFCNSLDVTGTNKACDDCFRKVQLVQNNDSTPPVDPRIVAELMIVGLVQKSMKEVLAKEVSKAIKRGLRKDADPESSDVDDCSKAGSDLDDDGTPVDVEDKIEPASVNDQRAAANEIADDPEEVLEPKLQQLLERLGTGRDLFRVDPERFNAPGMNVGLTSANMTDIPCVVTLTKKHRSCLFIGEPQTGKCFLELFKCWVDRIRRPKWIPMLFTDNNSSIRKQTIDRIPDFNNNLKRLFRHIFDDLGITDDYFDTHLALKAPTAKTLPPREDANRVRRFFADVEAGVLHVVNGNSVNFRRLYQLAEDHPEVKWSITIDEADALAAYTPSEASRQSLDLQIQELESMTNETTKAILWLLRCFRNYWVFRRWALFTATPTAIWFCGIKTSINSCLMRPSDYRSPPPTRGHPLALFRVYTNNNNQKALLRKVWQWQRQKGKSMITVLDIGEGSRYWVGPPDDDDDVGLDCVRNVAGHSEKIAVIGDLLEYLDRKERKKEFLPVTIIAGFKATRVDLLLFQSQDHGEGLNQSASRLCGTAAGQDRCLFYCTKKTWNDILMHLKSNAKFTAAMVDRADARPYDLKRIEGIIVELPKSARITRLDSQRGVQLQVVKSSTGQEYRIDIVGDEPSTIAQLQAVARRIVPNFVVATYRYEIPKFQLPGPALESALAHKGNEMNVPGNIQKELRDAIIRLIEKYPGNSTTVNIAYDVIRSKFLDSNPFAKARSVKSVAPVCADITFDSICPVVVFNGDLHLYNKLELNTAYVIHQFDGRSLRMFITRPKLHKGNLNFEQVSQLLFRKEAETNPSPTSTPRTPRSAQRRQKRRTHGGENESVNDDDQTQCLRLKPVLSEFLHHIGINTEFQTADFVKWCFNKDRVFLFNPGQAIPENSTNKVGLRVLSPHDSSDPKGRFGKRVHKDLTDLSQQGVLSVRKTCRGRNHV
ncbi:hypothetical protein HDV00_012467 [Rhizophlyctis rosea]|nr:hypothetical protein HDV00_012467 [Rhizophlyctis rosea]